ncbi:MAG: hypothetical protein LBL80_03185 [Ruminococcus sp.]|jgi:hypothetical protein|nr:hypothetical protein [Ruminococcus sp.]
MKLKKILAIIAAGALAISALAIPTSAADDFTFIAGAKDGVTWADTNTDVTISGNGDYTVTLDVSATGADSWGYFWLTGSDEAPAGYENATITMNSFKINGTEWAFATTEAPLLTKGRIGEIPIFNVWNKTKEMLDMTNTKASGQLYAFLDADGKNIVIDSFELNFTISGVDGEGAVASADAAPASDGETTSATTGNMPIALIGGAAIVALGVAVVSRKRR